MTDFASGSGATIGSGAGTTSCGVTGVATVIAAMVAMTVDDSISASGIGLSEACSSFGVATFCPRSSARRKEVS